MTVTLFWTLFTVTLIQEWAGDSIFSPFSTAGNNVPGAAKNNVTNNAVTAPAFLCCFGFLLFLFGILTSRLKEAAESISCVSAAGTLMIGPKDQLAVSQPRVGLLIETDYYPNRYPRNRATGEQPYFRLPQSMVSTD